MKHSCKNRGFTLVELTVSVAITAILMLGISVFFSSTFRNMFLQREQLGNSQSQFVVNTILREKFANVTGLEDSGTDFAVIRNDTRRGDLPFTYISDEGSRVVFKDFFPFNGRFEGSVSSTANFDNPGGMTKLGSNYFVAAPLEDEIKICQPLGSCSTLGLSGSYAELDHPTDVAVDAATSMLYIADSGNGRIVSVDLGGGQSTGLVADNLNFPVGIEFYSINGNNYLFFSEPYQNRVSRVKTDGSSLRVVAGNGNNEGCDGITAEFCKLNFPTGLLVADGGLFIADTGNRRILELTEPELDLADLPFEYGLDPGNQISYIDFNLPAGSVINTVDQGASGNTLRDSSDTAHYEKQSDEVARLMLNAVLTSVATTSPGTCPPSCTTYVTSFEADNAEDIFEDSDSVDINGTTYNVNSPPGGDTVSVSLNSTIPSQNDVAHVNNTFSAGDYTFNLDLSDTTLPTGFQKAQVTAFDKTDTALNQDSIFLRLPDGELGSEEDLITVAVAYDPSNTFITGLAWDSGLQFSNIPDPDDYDGFDDYDYTSGFDVQGFSFDTTNSDKVLELTFDAELGLDLDEQPIWESFIFNANITPITP